MTEQPAGQPSEREIKQSVVERYGARARAALQSAGVETASAEACCGPADGAPAGSTQPQAIEFIEVAEAAEGAACGPDCCGDAEAVAGSTAESTAESAADLATGEFGAALYATGELDAVPEAAQQAAAGCGNPVAISELRTGESVLDLGSGGGIDCFLAAQQVGETGEVWGLDMTPDMVQLARRNAEQVGADNVRFRLGEIEDLPFGDEKFDAIISNCVINLSPDKPQVFREAFRVLGRGGRLRVSDIVLTKELPEERRRDLEQWAGCIAGALPVEQYLEAIRNAGFVDVEARYEREATTGIASAYVTARRPS